MVNFAFGLSLHRKTESATVKLALITRSSTALSVISIILIRYRICRNKHPGRLISKSNKNHFQNPSKPIGFVYSPLWKITHPSPSVLCTPPFEKSLIKTYQFCVLPPLKNHPSKAIGFVYSPLWKVTVFGGRLFRGGRLFWQIRYVTL